MDDVKRHIETGELIYSEIQLTDFYIVKASVVNGFKKSQAVCENPYRYSAEYNLAVHSQTS